VCVCVCVAHIYIKYICMIDVYVFLWTKRGLSVCVVAGFVQKIHFTLPHAQEKMDQERGTLKLNMIKHGRVMISGGLRLEGQGRVKDFA